MKELDFSTTSTDDIFRIVQKDPVTFIHGDNMQLLRWLKDNMHYKYFHVGIVDPPYGISVGDMNLGATKNSAPRKFKMGNWDNAVPTQEYWDLLSYCCRELIIWGGNYFTDKYGQVTRNDAPAPIKPGRCFYVWDKLNNGMSFADCELAITTLDKNARLIKKSRAMQEDDGDKRHPTHKPVYVYDAIYTDNDFSRKRILDTHGGSFSHAIAAYRNNAQLVIIEREESYFNDGLDAYMTASQKGRLLF